MSLKQRKKKGNIKGFRFLKDEEVKLNRLDVELDNKLDNLREEYFLSFEGAKEEFHLTVPIDEARKKVKLIKLQSKN